MATRLQFLLQDHVGIAVFQGFSGLVFRLVFKLETMAGVLVAQLVGRASFLTTRTDCRWWFDSPLVREKASSGDPPKGKGRRQKKIKLETMAQLSEEAQMMLQSVTQAAKAAADAAQALRESNIQQLAKSTGFAEANTTVQCPKEFGSSVSAEDQNGWSDFAFAFKQWLCFADTAFTADLDFVEEHSDVAVTYKDTAEGKASEQRSKKLYAILSGILRNRPLRLLKQVADNNGLEVWRQLHSLYTIYPKDKGEEYGHFGNNNELSCLLKRENSPGANPGAGALG